MCRHKKTHGFANQDIASQVTKLDKSVGFTGVHCSLSFLGMARLTFSAMNIELSGEDRRASNGSLRFENVSLTSEVQMAIPSPALPFPVIGPPSSKN